MTRQSFCRLIALLLAFCAPCSALAQNSGTSSTAKAPSLEYSPFFIDEASSRANAQAQLRQYFKGLNSLYSQDFDIECGASDSLTVTRIGRLATGKAREDAIKEMRNWCAGSLHRLPHRLHLSEPEILVYTECAAQISFRSTMSFFWIARYSKKVTLYMHNCAHPDNSASPAGWHADSLTHS